MIAASVGLSLVLFLSMAFAVLASTATSIAVVRTREVRLLSVLYSSARFSIGAEESLERKYRLEPSAVVAAQHAAAGRELTATLGSIVRLASRPEAAEARRLLALHAQYVRESKRMFAAIDARDPARAGAIDRTLTDPVFSRIQDRVEARSVEQRHRAERAFDVLEQTQRYLVRMSIALTGLGSACLLAFLFVIYAYRHRLIVNHTAEVRRMEEAALIDSLTQIGNHRAFKDDIQRELALAVRHEVPLTLAMLDVDEFKMVNDQDGHVQGDRVLRSLASVLGAGRIEDRAYRIGGDEFALILPHTSAGQARLVLERVRISASQMLHGSTVSIGSSTVEDFDIGAEALQNQADAALYLTKRGGRNAISQYDGSDKATWMRSSERVQCLRALLASGALPIAFQPIWDLERAEILAFEALLRPNATFGFGGPQDAFDLAERIGCAHELDRASWTSALRRANELPTPALLFVNLSPQTLDRDFDVVDFAASVATARLRPQNVVIEITERSIAHLENVIAVARSLKEAGFGIALDDTGAGHAGLEIMSRVPFDYVKIDREIIVKAMSDRSASGVVAAIVAFARVTGAYVIAEGIEDIATLDFVDRAGHALAAAGRGIRGAQGYLLNRPSEALPRPSDVVDVRALLTEHIVCDKVWFGEGTLPGAAGRLNV